MNVANRKLFANRDARKKLAEMGGILASSPELLGEAMKFAEAGQIDVQMYIINVPGLTAPGEYLKISEETLMQLNDIVPELMSQQETLVQPAEAIEGYIDSRPGDALLPKRLRDIGAIPAQEQGPVDERGLGQRVGDTLRDALQPIGDAFRDVGQPVGAAFRDVGQPVGDVLSDVGQSVGQDIRSGLESSYDYNPLSGNFTEQNLSEMLLTPRPSYDYNPLSGNFTEQSLSEMLLDQGPIPTPTGYGDIKPGQGYDAASLFGSGNIFTNQGVTAGGPGMIPEGSSEREPYVPPTMGPTELNIPAIRNALQSPNAGLATDLKAAAEEAVANLPQSAADQTVADFPEPETVVGSGPRMPGFDPTLGLYNSLVQKRKAMNVPGVDIPRDSEAAADLDAQIKALESDPALIPAIKKQQKSAEQQKVDELSALERKQMEGFPKVEFAKATDAVLQSVINNPNNALDATLVNLDELANKYQQPGPYKDGYVFPKKDGEKGDGKGTGGKKDGGKGKGGKDTGALDLSSMSREDKINKSYEYLQQLFGLSDKEKAQDAMLTMAQFGFAMAAGTSEYASTNIANAASAALAQLREDRSTDRERADKLKLLAYEQVLDEEKEAREAARLLGKQRRDDEREIDIYRKKKEIEAEFATEKEPQWLKDMQSSWESTLSDMGGDPGAALTAFRELYSPEAIDLWMMSRKMLTGGGTNPAQKRDLSVIQ